MLLAGVAAAADGSAHQPPATVPAQCELLFEGRFAPSIEKLTLIHQSDWFAGNGKTLKLERPGARVLLPAGTYKIVEIRLPDDYLTVAADRRDTLVLSPEKPCRLAVLPPLTPRVSAKRSGRLLVLDCQVYHADGKKATYAEKFGCSRPPQFRIYQGDRQIASGSFEYG
jgi:hypothetical protein